MTGAMYAAIAGLKTHMQKLNVIGNNVANVNTQGYKAQRAIFKDAMYTLYSSGSNGTEVKGGQNPSQIGYGSQISSIDLNMRPGSFSPGNPMDCMIAPKLTPVCAFFPPTVAGDCGRLLEPDTRSIILITP